MRTQPLALVLGLAACQAPASSAPTIAPLESEQEPPRRAPHAVGRLLAAGNSTCAVRDDGTWCWGANPYWPFDRGPRLLAVPTRIEALAGLRVLTVAWSEYCAAFDDDSVRCWNSGHGFESGPELWPVVVARARDAVGIVQVAFGSCAWLADESVVCWERAGYGRGAPTATTVPDVRGVVALAGVGGTICALRRSGDVDCWGEAWSGGLASWAPGGWDTPKRIPGLHDVRSLVVDGSGMGWVVDGEEKTWTFRLEVDAAGLPYVRGPRRYEELRGVRALLGKTTGCWLFARTLRCRGEEWPTPDGPRTTSRDVAVGGLHACVRAHDGEVWCAGDNRVGQLGDGTNRRSVNPVRVRWP
jgi:hypothetical protein